MQIHENSDHCQTINTTNADYYNYGDWFYYNGNSSGLYNVLTNYQPSRDNIPFLISRLETECEIHKYENTLQILWRWAKSTLTCIGTIPATLLDPLVLDNYLYLVLQINLLKKLTHLF